MRVEAENGATAGKFDLAKRAKAADLDAIHDTVHEMARDEARHGKAFAGLLTEILRGIRIYLRGLQRERIYPLPYLFILLMGFFYEKPLYNHIFYMIFRNIFLFLFSFQSRNHRHVR